PPATAQSTAWLMVSSGFAPPPVADETPEERDKRIKAMNLYVAALEAVKEADRGYKALHMLRRVVIEECDENLLTDSDIGDLRIALNAAGRVLGVLDWRSVA